MAPELMKTFKETTCSPEAGTSALPIAIRTLRGSDGVARYCYSLRRPAEPKTKTGEERKVENRGNSPVEIIRLINVESTGAE